LRSCNAPATCVSTAEEWSPAGRLHDDKYKGSYSFGKHFARNARAFEHRREEFNVSVMRL